MTPFMVCGTRKLHGCTTSGTGDIGGFRSATKTIALWSDRLTAQIQQSNVGAVNLTNSYRPDGLRHRRTDNTGTTQVIWDGDDLLAQVDLLGNLVQYWTWAPELPEGRWSRLVKSRFPTTNAHPDQYLHSDWLGTVVALSLPDGTALLHSGTHPRPWGEEDSAAVGPLSWVGNQGYWRE